MSKHIEFIPRLNMKDHWHTLEKPKSAKLYISDWYKKTPFYKDANKKLDAKEGMTLKACVPFLDGMTIGYMITTWFDIKVVQTDTGPRISWALNYNPIDIREDIQSPNPDGFYSTMFAFQLPFGFKLPKGYSMLLTPALNKNENPIFVPSAVIDDNVTYAGQLPFWIKDGFEGIIPIGTPICQIIPFKRESWTSSINEDLSEDAEKLRVKADTYISGFYKKFIYKKKSFE